LSKISTDPTPLVSLAETDRASVLSLVRPPLVIVVVVPVFVPIVVLKVSAGIVVSTVAVTAGLVVNVLPAASVAFAVKLCAPLARDAFVNVQVPLARDPLSFPTRRSSDLLSKISTDPTPLVSLAETDRASVLSLVRPPLVIVVVVPVFVPI